MEIPPECGRLEKNKSICKITAGYGKSSGKNNRDAGIKYERGRGGGYSGQERFLRRV